MFITNMPLKAVIPRHPGAPDKGPGVTVRGWLAGLSTSFGLGAAPWVCQPDGVIISIWLGTPGHPGFLGPGLLGHVPLLSPKHLRTLGPPGPEVAVRGSVGGLIIRYSEVPRAWVAYLMPPSPGNPPGGHLELCLGSPLAQVCSML